MDSRVCGVLVCSCFVSLSRHVDGRVLIADISDNYIKDVKAAYPPLTPVTGRVIAYVGCWSPPLVFLLCPHLPLLISLCWQSLDLQSGPGEEAREPVAQALGGL